VNADLFWFSLSRRGLPKRSDPSWTAEARNRDIIKPHKNAIKKDIIKNGVANSQVVYAVCWGVRSREEAYKIASAAEKGQMNNAGKAYQFTILGGNHFHAGTSEAVPEIEATNPERAKEIRVMKVTVVAFPNYSEKSEEGRAQIVKELRNVSLFFCDCQSASES
jgi:hypothetical protein